MNIVTIGAIASSRNSTGGSSPSFDWYVTTVGSDTNDGLTAATAFLTVAKALTVASSGETISVGAGTFTETSYLNVPVGVSIEGAGKDVTFIRAHSSLYASYTGSAWLTDKFLMVLSSASMTTSDQSIKNCTLDGVSRQTRGAIYIKHRRNVILENVKVINFQATGIWWDRIENGLMRGCYSSNCGWASFAFALGGTNLNGIDGLEIDDCYFNEDSGYGYGIKCIGPGTSDADSNIEGLYMHDSTVTVHPTSLWNGGSAPNIAFEAWAVDRKLGIEFSNVYFDNHISLVDANANTYTGTPTVSIHGCTFDIMTRAAGSGYGIECQIGDVEIYDNYFWGGSIGIVQWGSHLANYWRIHDNVFYDQFSFYPTAIITAYNGAAQGLYNAQIYNNTVHMSNTSTATYNSQRCELSFLQLDQFADMTNCDIANNVIINTSGGTNCKFINLRTGNNQLSGTTIRYNFGQNLNGGVNQGISGATYTSNSTGTAAYLASGARPTPYYKPTPAGNLDQTGINVGLPFTGTAPSIGAYEA